MCDLKLCTALGKILFRCLEEKHLFERCHLPDERGKEQWQGDGWIRLHKAQAQDRSLELQMT